MVEGCSYNIAAGSFTQGNFVADLFRQKVNFTGKNSKIAFCANFWGLWVKYTVHLWSLESAWSTSYIVLIELFSPALTVEALFTYIGRNCGVRKGGGSL